MALTTAAVAGFNALAPNGPSLYCIAEPVPSAPPDRTDATGAVLPLDLLPLVQRPAGARLRIRRLHEPPLGPGTPSSATSFTDIDLAGLKKTDPNDAEAGSWGGSRAPLLRH